MALATTRGSIMAEIGNVAASYGGWMVMSNPLR